MVFCSQLACFGGSQVARVAVTVALSPLQWTRRFSWTSEFFGHSSYSSHSSHSIRRERAVQTPDSFFSSTRGAGAEDSALDAGDERDRGHFFKRCAECKTIGPECP